MLTEKQLQQIRDELESCKNPFFFFHDDPDGLASYLLLRRYTKEGHGIPVKSTPRVDEKFLNKIEEYTPDKIFITDIAMVDEKFVEKVHVPIIWIDHHEPADVKGVKYFNPRVSHPTDNLPASFLCYEVVKQDLWIAITGIVGDWTYSKHHKQFAKEYPDLLPKDMTDPGQIMFETKIGQMSQIMAFCLKGKTSVVNKLIKEFIKVHDPYDILERKTTGGKMIMDYYTEMSKEYEDIVKEAVKCAKEDDKLLVFTYPDDNMSYSGGISNELLYKFRDKVVIIGRIKDGTVRCSFRSSPPINVRDLVSESMHGLEGFSGGHEHACGGNIKVEDFDKFIENLRSKLAELKQN